MKIRCTAGAALRPWFRFALLVAALAAPVVEAAVPTPTFDSTCGTSGCHVKPPEGGRLNASYSSAFIAKAIADNYGPGMSSLSAVSGTTLTTIATEIGDYFGVTPQSATVPFQTTTSISLVGKIALGTFYAKLDTINVTIAASAGSATTVTTPGSEAINYTPPACATGSRSFTYNASSTTPSAQTTSTRTINVTISNPTAGPTFSSPPASMNAQTGVAVSPVVTFTATCNAIVTYSLAAGSLPTGMSLSSGGQVSGTPASSNPTGTYNVTVRATYPGGMSTTTPFAVNLTLGPPDLSGSAATATGLEGAVFTPYQIVATNGSTFTYSATGLPPGLIINPGSGQITGTPSITANPGASTVYPVTIGASNGTLGSTRLVNFTINATPVVNSPATATGPTLAPFTYTITATKSPTSYSATGLPAGITLPAGSNVISGSPTTVGVYSVSITASNANGPGPPFVLTLTITLGVPTVTSAATASAGEAQPFTYQILATNGPPFTGYGLTGTLPAGLSFDPVNGIISGTPSAGSGSAAGTHYALTINASNASGPGPGAPLDINVSAQKPVVTSGSTASGQTGSPFSYQIAASFAPTSFQAGCPTTASPLPPGLTLNPTTGLISGIPTVAASTPCQITATNGSGTSIPPTPLTINITLGPPVITSAGAVSGAQGIALSYQVAATNNPTTYGASGLPPGVTINTASGLVSGTPTASGTYNAIVTATNGTATATKAVVFTIGVGIPAITSATTASAATGYPFSFQVVATNGPTSYAATGLPPGVSLNPATGLIGGSFANAGTYVIGLTATNGTGSGTATLTINVIQSAPGLTSSTTASAAVGQPFSYVVTVANGPASISVGALPPGLVFDAPSGVISGTPTAGGTFNVPVSISNSTATISATLIITVAFLAPTTVDSSVEVAYETATPVPLPLSGQVLQLTIVSMPSHGLLTVTGTQVVYTPANGYSGADSFTYTASNPAGSSAVATVKLNVGTQIPVAVAMAMQCDVNSSASADLSKVVKGSGLTGISIATSPTHGKVAVNGMVVTYTPNTDYFGADSFSYIAYGNAGKSSPAAISVKVVGRPDPTKDANVRGLVDAQAQAARRYSAAQVGNFQRRMETLHRAPPPVEGSAAVEAPAATARVGAVGDAAKAPAAGATQDRGTAAPVVGSMVGSLVAPFVSAAMSRSFDLNGSTAGGGNGPLAAGVNAWIGGTAQFGRRTETTDQSPLRFSTDGLSIGLDRRFGERLVLGLGFGYGQDETRVGTDGSRSKSNGQSFALYGSFQPSGGVFVDALLGMGKLDFDNRRHVAALDEIASGKRRGEQSFASIASGIELRREGVLFSPYGRLDATQDRLKGYDEQGVGDYALHFDEMRVRSTQVAAGLRVETQHDTDFGSAQPRVRLEYRRELQDDARATLRYADLIAGPQYAVTSTGVSRNALLLGVGSDFLFRGGLRVGVDYVAQRASGAANVQGVRVMASLDLDGRGSPFAWQPRMFKDPIGVEAGYTFDDNVTRGRVHGEKLGDDVFSLAAGEPIPIKLGSLSRMRLVITPQVQGEKFRLYQGLGKVSAGAQAELQYRGSGAFDATTYGLVGRAAYDQYESTLRRGARYFAGLNARRSLTDRIDVFAEAGHAWREGKSDVFRTREWIGKMNLDYSLGGKRGLLYVAGEYRRGDTFASGGPSLVNVGLADVFVPDDAFGSLGFFAYRFDARTALGTIGWNYPLGPRDSIDLSWRRVQTTPTGRTAWDSGTLRYIDNQYSLVYLMRF